MIPKDPLGVGDDKGFRRTECVLGVELEIEGVGLWVVVVSGCIGAARIHAVEADALSEVSDGGLLQVAETSGSIGLEAHFNAVVGGDSNGVVEPEEEVIRFDRCDTGSISTALISPGFSLPLTQTEKAD